LSTAMRYPEKIVKVAVIGSPITGSSLNVFLKLSGYPQIASLLWLLPPVRTAFIGAIGYMSANNGRAAMNMILRDATQVSMQSFFQSIGTLRQTDLRPRLNEVKVPTLGMYGRKDIIVSPRQRDVLKAGVKHAQISYYKDAGHFPMLDNPERFNEELRTFLIAKQ
jgi:pimeloyl-ACP methyl ester carboxylesterase